jgi:hypothetical protein
MTLEGPNTLSFTIPYDSRNAWGVGSIIANALTSQSGIIYVYCSLCPSVIQTALFICAEPKEKVKAASVWARPINCITASCFSTEDDSI